MIGLIPGDFPDFAGKSGNHDFDSSGMRPAVFLSEKPAEESFLR